MPARSGRPPAAAPTRYRTVTECRANTHVQAGPWWSNPSPLQARRLVAGPAKGAWQMNVGLREEGSVTVCCVEGNLEYLTVSQFRTTVAQLPAGHHVVFDLTGTTFIDSAGIGALIGAIRRAREMGSDAAVCGLRPSVLRVLNLVGLPRVVSIVDNLPAAVELLGAAVVA